MTIQSFEIEVQRSVLDDVKERLSRTRWTDAIEGAGWEYGTNPQYLKQLCDYWRDTFDWQKQQADLNVFRHFRADVDGIGIHFIHERGNGGAIPILLLGLLFLIDQRLQRLQILRPMKINHHSLPPYAWESAAIATDRKRSR